MLRKLIKARYDDVPAKFARAAKKSPTQVNDMLAGTKPFGEKVARSIEAELRLPRYYFENVFPWPFDIDPARLAGLSDKQIGQIEGAIKTLLSEFEAASSKQDAA